MNKQFRIAAQSKPAESVIVGKMGAVYGIRGWIRVYSFTEKSESIFNYRPWFITKEDKLHLIELESWKRHNRDWIIKIRNIKNRKEAILLTNFEIIIDASQLPHLDNGEYYWKDLLGCQIVTVNGDKLGEVVGFMETGSNDAMVVKTNQKDAFGIKELLIPFIDGQVIKNVDLTNHIINIDWNPGF
ncbi:ribosome maturation factor RimM [Sodalis endosymbiont of Henestaris halophilus]|uniref:ribosome maturation factor RimM n=1 Tax=Sodalis endosymbiont of Henestaris halophilus TaxID=1929246 RepID=UPI000BC08A60|nr:ribosome maturation factor RimM [Sodalis endosymbiont of Henestaris halophilus]SNC58558.1 Ribosome maturation factor RimM [Sodalis endosymbiont of Henestaris halophilus]